MKNTLSIMDWCGLTVKRAIKPYFLSPEELTYTLYYT